MMTSPIRFFDNLAYLFIQCDPAFKIKHCNAFTLQVVGLNKNELLGHPLVQYFHVDDQANVQALLDSGHDLSTSNQTHRWRKADGSFLWCQWQLVPDEDSTDIYFMGEDVSEPRRIKRALEALETVTDTGYWEIDLDTHYLYWSDVVHRVHETDPSSYRPKLEDGINYYQPDCIQTLKDALQNLEKTGQPYSKDLNFITSQGKQLIVNATGFSEKMNGRVVRNYGTFKDLTKQKEDDIARQRLEQRVILALKAAKIGVWELDLLSDTLIWDDRLFEIYGISRKNFRGKTQDWIDSIHPEDVEKAQAALSKAISTHTYFEHKFRIVTEAGETRYILGLADFIYDENNSPIKATGINIDDTDAENTKNELTSTYEAAQESAKLAQVMAEKAKAADKQKSVFLANMSHEIRTPISGILGLVTLLLEDTRISGLEPHEKQHYLRLIKSSSEHLLSIISDILDFSKIEADKIIITHDVFNFNDLTENLITDFARRAAEKQIAFHYKTNEDKPIKLIGDPLRLKQILYNLLGNALKFTQEGSVNVDVQLSTHEDDTATLVCTVVDTGIGIAKDQQSLLFMPFSQVDSSATRKSQGTGLGLSISRNLIELMNGTITVESELGKGSRFTFSVPLGLSTPIAQTSDIDEETSPTATVSTLCEDCIALVAEDNEINQVVIESQLSKLGIKSVIAGDGEQALEYLARQAEFNFSFILMDCQMPKLDGFEATHIIRHHQRFNKVRNIPIIALTANAMVGDKDKCIKAGMNDYLTKPVNIAMLKPTILKILGKISQ
ncbi:PAS domain-containing protein [Paraglaciecola sp.]|uniref:PAS domain-containing protein n=1 Tax=Paraglaciecola sp. TaxID=1920173 RepID=UPI00273D11B4|nr:PAS domain-containing protein [Paraglaciecola sp.]MDP5032093.1 PAS domain-containing protein [Paraglaciecola sp.]